MVAQRMTRMLGDSSEDVNMCGGTVSMGAWKQQQMFIPNDSGLQGNKLTALSLQQMTVDQNQMYQYASTPTPSEGGDFYIDENSCPSAVYNPNENSYASADYFAYMMHSQQGMDAGYQPVQAAQPAMWSANQPFPTVFYSHVVQVPVPVEQAVPAEWGYTGEVNVDAYAKDYGSGRQEDRQGPSRGRWANKKISREQVQLKAAKGPSEVEVLKRATRSATGPCKNHSSKPPSGSGSTWGGSERESADLSDGDGQSEAAHVVKPQDSPSLLRGNIVDRDAPAYHISGDPMMMDLDSDGPRREVVLDWVLQSFWPMAMNKKGCRVLQKAFDVGSPAYRQMLVQNLRGQVHQTYQSPHANYVLQKVIEVMPSDDYQFVLEELDQQILYVVRHRFGCRILQRLLEHCPLEQIEPMMSKVMRDVKALIRHQYGNFVLQHILQYGSPAHRHIIAEVVHADIIRLAKHHLASHVVSCALVHCEPEDVKVLVHAVLHDAGQLAQLSRREFGSFVVREANRVARILGV